MGKYDKLKGKLPAFEQESSFQAQVNEAKSTFQALEMSELAREFGRQRSVKKNLETAISDVNVELEALSQLLLQNFEAQQIQKLQLATGETCYSQSEPYSSVTDLPALYAWVKKEKLQSLLTLQWQTMNALNKERLVAGKPPLAGTAVFLKTSIRLRGGGANDEE